MNFMELMGLIHLAKGSSGAAGAVYVTFMSHDGTVELYKRAVLPGNDCMEVVSGGLLATPTRESTAQHNYTFAGWATEANGGLNANALKNVTEDRAVYANYIATVRYYTISYYDTDGTLLHSEQLAYGSTPSYTPEKDGFIFTGWEEAVTTVTGDASYTAAWLDMSAYVAYGECGDNVSWTLNNAGELRISGTGPMYDDYTDMNYPWKAHRDSILTIVIEEGVTTVGAYTAYSTKNLQSMTIPAGVVSIGTNALCGSNITSLIIPDSVVSIGKSAFASTAITSLIIPDSVVSIGPQLFRYCTAITSVTFGKGITEIPEQACYSCSALETIVMSDDVTKIGDDAFYGCSKWNYPSLPSSLEYIGDRALRGISPNPGQHTRALPIPASVNYIGKNAFQYFASACTWGVAFENTSGWWVSEDSTATSGTALSASNLANTATAKTYLTSTYLTYYWHRS